MPLPALWFTCHFLPKNSSLLQKDHRIIGWKRPIRSSSPTLNPEVSINSLINRFEWANICTYDYAAAVPEGRLRIQNMKQLDGYLDNDVKSIELKWIPFFCQSWIISSITSVKH